MTDIKPNDVNKYDDIIHKEIIDEMETSYLNYAMSVIVARALPDAKDGLKPVQRRILYAMYKLGFLHNKAYKKSARTVGEVIGKYHPHGEVAVYDSLVRMAQDFSMRYQLVDGQGNFGSIDGDSPAASRYTESKLKEITLEVLDGIERNTVNFIDNYDASTREPEILPSKLPLLLLNGADGIAVGMATKIPPHNLTELCNAILEIIKRGNGAEHGAYIIPNYAELIKTVADIANLPKERFPTFKAQITAHELLEFITGPDFPTGAEIYDQSQTLEAYSNGRGRIMMRAIAKIEESKNGKFEIIISELPYQVNKSRLIAKIADLVKDKKIKGISDIRDESSKGDIRIAVYIKRDGKPKTILNRLYKYTEMQKAFNVNMLALVDGEPQTLSVKRLLEIFIEHRQKVIIRRTEFDLAKSKEREHILEGLMIALDHLDEIIALIRKSKDAEEAKNNLIQKFKLSELQAQAILDMQLRRLAALERKRIEEEYKTIKTQIAQLLSTLEVPERVLEIITLETEDIKKKFGDKRRTKVHKNAIGEISDEQLIPSEEVIVTVSEQGYIKRINQNSYQVQKRGGVGKKFMTTKEDDSVKHVISTNTHDDMLFFTDRGKVFKVKVYDIPEFGRSAKGQPVINLINVDPNELVTSILTRTKGGLLLDEDIGQENEIKSESKGKNYKYLLMATRKGMVKKTDINEFDNIKSNGLIAINLSQDDTLTWVRPTGGQDEIILITKHGRSIKFKEDDVRGTGRSSMGVRGIKFKSTEDEVIAMDVVRNNELLVLTISEDGFGKVTKLNQFPIQNRGGQGVFAAKVTDKTGNLISARIIDHPNKELLLMSLHGNAVKIPVVELPERNRQTCGVHLIRLKGGDKVAAMAIV